jgi:uncharacterized protein YndB with AHSA1/START domain
MRKTLKLIALVAAVLIAGVLAYAATKPDTFRVQRTLTIQAPPEKIFPLINELPRWKEWSPYEKKDPAMKRSFSGPAGGKGASYAWEGNNEVGQGRMEIAETTPPSKVIIDLHFLKPFEGRNTAEFTLDRKGEATNVTWSMYGPAPYLNKLMSTFFDMDSMIGNDFAAGLASLKALAEK